MTDDIRDDLAYVKALAEEGRDTPLVGGVLYVIWGALIGITSLVSYAIGQGWVDPGPVRDVWPWVIAIGVGWALSFYTGRKTHSKPGAATLGNKTAMAVWFAIGIFSTGFWVTLMMVHNNFTAVGVPPYFLFGLMFPLAFGLYGVAFFATATAARTPWLAGVAVIAWVFSAASLVLMANANQMLVGALGSFVCILAPGIILMRNEPSEIV